MVKVGEPCSTNERDEEYIRNIIRKIGVEETTLETWVWMGR
jgi:hypothetical protein